MEVTWISDQWIRETNREYQSTPSFKSHLFRIPKRKYITIEITGDERKDALKVGQLSKFTDRLVEKEDSINAIK